MIVLASALITGCFKSSGSHALLPEILRAEDHYARMEPSRALEILVPMLKAEPDGLPDKYFEVRIKSHLRALQFKQALDSVLLWEKQVGKTFPDKRRHVLISFIRNRATIPNPQVQVEAVKALGSLKDKKMKQYLQEMFPQSDALVKLSIAHAMTSLDDFDRAIKYLTERSQYGSRNERFLASLYLIELRDLRLKDFYLKLLDDSENAIRALGLNIVGEMKILEGRDKIRGMRDNSVSWSMKILTSQALYRLGDRQAEAELIEALKIPDLAKSVQLLLAQIGRKASLNQLKSKYSDLSDEEKSALLKLLSEQGETDFVLDRCRENLKSLLGEIFGQKMYLELLGDFGGIEDFDLLIPFLASPFEQVRVSGVLSMIKILDRQDSIN